jgi:F-box-like
MDSCHLNLNIFDLPTEIFVEIFHLLNPFELLKFTQICKKSRKISEDLVPILYRKQFNLHYNNNYKDKLISSVFKRGNELGITWGDNQAYW